MKDNNMAETNMKPWQISFWPTARNQADVLEKIQTKPQSVTWKQFWWVKKNQTFNDSMYLDTNQVLGTIANARADGADPDVVMKDLQSTWYILEWRDKVERGINEKKIKQEERNKKPSLLDRQKDWLLWPIVRWAGWLIWAGKGLVEWVKKAVHLWPVEMTQNIKRARNDKSMTPDEKFSEIIIGSYLWYIGGWIWDISWWGIMWLAEWMSTEKEQQSVKEWIGKKIQDSPKAKEVLGWYDELPEEWKQEFNAIMSDAGEWLDFAELWAWSLIRQSIKKPISASVRVWLEKMDNLWQYMWKLFEAEDLTKKLLDVGLPKKKVSKIREAINWAIDWTLTRDQASGKIVLATKPNLTSTQKGAGLTEDIATAIANNPKRFKEYVEIANVKGSAVDADTALQVAVNRGRQAINQIKTMANDIWSTIGKIKNQLADVNIDESSVRWMRDDFAWWLDKLNLNLIDGIITRKPWRVWVGTPEADIRSLQRMYDEWLAILSENPDMENYFKYLDWIRQRSNLDTSIKGTASPNVKAFADEVQAEARLVGRNMMTPEQRKAFDEYSELITFTKQFDKVWGTDARFWLLLKRAMSGKSGEVVDVLANIKKHTGIDLMEDAVFSKTAIELVGTRTQKDLLQQSMEKAGMEVMWAANDVLSGRPMNALLKLYKMIFPWEESVDVFIKASETLKPWFTYREAVELLDDIAPISNKQMDDALDTAIKLDDMWDIKRGENLADQAIRWEDILDDAQRLDIQAKAVIRNAAEESDEVLDTAMWVDLRWKVDDINTLDKTIDTDLRAWAQNAQGGRFAEWLDNVATREASEQTQKQLLDQTINKNIINEARAYEQAIEAETESIRKAIPDASDDVSKFRKGMMSDKWVITDRWFNGKKAFYKVEWDDTMYYKWYAQPQWDVANETLDLLNKYIDEPRSTRGNEIRNTMEALGIDDLTKFDDTDLQDVRKIVFGRNKNDEYRDAFERLQAKYSVAPDDIVDTMKSTQNNFSTDDLNPKQPTKTTSNPMQVRWASDFNKVSPTQSADLATEAKKYKSADEFVSSNVNMYHWTNAKFDEFDIGKIGSQTDDWLYGRWFYFSPSESYAKNAPRWWAKEVMRVSVDTDRLFDIRKYNDLEEFADMLDMSSSALRKSSDWTIRPLLPHINQFTSKVEDLWFDGVKVVNNGKIWEVVIFDPSNIKTETQLKEIREQANK